MIQQYIQKADVLLEALPYIQRFQGEPIVVKFGGSIMDEPDVYRQILMDIVFMSEVGLRPVVVHGGGKAISRKMQEQGLKPLFVQGLRVTDAASIKIVDEVLNGEINQELVDLIRSYNCKAERVRGNDIIKVRKHTAKDPATGALMDWGFVGEVTMADTTGVRALLDQETVPVITPLGTGSDGQLYNVNADEAAGAIARALKARKLVFLSDVPGLLADPKDPSSLIPTLRVAEVKKLIADGVISGGMIPKVGGALKALEFGIPKVHFIDAHTDHSLLLELFTDQGVGTEIVL
jgi:acetylglutamate kinase